MSYDKKQRREEIDKNHQKHLNEQESNPLTSDKKEIDNSYKKEEQQQNDRQFVDREELNDNIVETDNMSKPDVVDSDKESLFDKHDDMKTVDPLPVEELNEGVKDEKDKDHTKDTSSSEKKDNM